MADSNFVWYWCKICRKTFPQRDLLVKHKKTVHSNQIVHRAFEKEKKNGLMRRLRPPAAPTVAGKVDGEKKIQNLLDEVEKTQSKIVQAGDGDSSPIVTESVQKMEDSDQNLNEKIVSNGQQTSSDLPPPEAAVEAPENPVNDAPGGDEGKKKSAHLNGILERLKLMAVQRTQEPQAEEEKEEGTTDLTDKSEKGDGVAEKSAEILKNVQSSLSILSATTEKRKGGHECPYCSKVLSSVSNLGDHVRAAHTGERPYHCQKCSKKFASRKTLSIHRLKFHSPSSSSSSTESYSRRHNGDEKIDEGKVTTSLVNEAPANPQSEQINILSLMPESNDFENDKFVEIWAADEKDFLAKHIAPKILNGWTFHFCSLCLNIFPYYISALKHVQQKHWPKRKNSSPDDPPSPPVEKKSNLSPVGEKKIQNNCETKLEIFCNGQENDCVTMSQGNEDKFEKMYVEKNDRVSEIQENDVEMIEKIPEVHSKIVEAPSTPSKIPVSLPPSAQNLNEKSLQESENNLQNAENLFLPPNPLCGSSLSRQIVEGNLRKKFLCKFCDATFDRPSHAFRHSRTHSSRPFKCPGCDMTFRIRRTLDIHRRKRHRKFKEDRLQKLAALTEEFKDETDNSMLEPWRPPHLNLNEIEGPLSSKAPLENGQVTFFLADFEEETEGWASLIQMDQDSNDPHYPDEEDEGQFCLCDGPADDSMVICDNTECTVKIFHLTCVGLSFPPTGGTWFCAQCRSDTNHENVLSLIKA